MILNGYSFNRIVSKDILVVIIISFFAVVVPILLLLCTSFASLVVSYEHIITSTFVNKYIPNYTGNYGDKNNDRDKHDDDYFYTPYV